MAREYEPGSWIERVSPTSLLMIVASKDMLTPTDLALDAHIAPLSRRSLSCFTVDASMLHGKWVRDFQRGGKK
jgi:uncharacterized protein